MTWQQVCASLAVLAGLSGCTVGPNYRPPQVPVPATWSAEVPGEAEARAAVAPWWWTTFTDPMLESLIARAVQSNRDLRTAAGRVREARALRGVTAADDWPMLDVSGSYNTTVPVTMPR
jgi:outer membrane protein, multidrug efflux system